MASGLVQRLHVSTCGGRGAAAVRALPWPRPVVGRDATVEVKEGRPPAVVATDMAVPPRTEATGRLPPPVDGMRALDAMPLLDSKILTIRESPGRIPTDFSAESPLICFQPVGRPSQALTATCTMRRTPVYPAPRRVQRGEGGQARTARYRRFVSPSRRRPLVSAMFENRRLPRHFYVTSNGKSSPDGATGEQARRKTKRTGGSDVNGWFRLIRLKPFLFSS